MQKWATTLTTNACSFIWNLTHLTHHFAETQVKKKKKKKKRLEWSGEVDTRGKSRNESENTVNEDNVLTRNQ